ncbi:(2,3-dihydroxybenzoyl)adenylate synthase [Paenarthrobacter sp. NPDC089989]|uniref:(2,3-dihydroxybenzoyl)adenylate synthase n=1 Tax=unclassified Paenarthrobacter TaxID=2634190 RepID=UPI00380DCB4D
MKLEGTIPWPAETAARYRAAGYWTGERLDRVGVHHANNTPEATAVVDDAERLTYAAFERRVAQMAGGFISLGIQPRDRVLLQLPNRVSFLVAALALMRAGAIPVYLLPAHRHSEVAAIAAQAEPVAYIGPSVHENFDYRPMAADLARSTAATLHRAALRVIIDGETLEGQLGLGEVLDSGLGRECWDGIPADTGDVAFLQLSGGTTGTPKLIPRTHDDYLYSVRQSVKVCGLDSGAVMLLVLPAAHNFPMSSPGFLGVLLAGGTIVLGSSAAPDLAFPVIERESVTIVPLVPPLALAWMRAAAGTTSNLQSLRTIQVGGAKFLPESARRIKGDLGANLQQVFGMAEGLVCYTREGDPDELVATSQGRPMSEADEVRVVDDEDQPVEDGTAGHLLTRGPYTIRGYYKAEQHNSTAFTADGFYRTGDIVRRLPGGYLSVEGRSKDQINRGGEKISAEEVEDHLLAHPLVHDAAVVAIPDPYLGERSCAVIVPAGDTTPARKEILQFIRDRGVAAHKIPDRVEIVPAFPTTGVGKNSRAHLRRTLAEQLRPATGLQAQPSHQ